MSTPMSASPPKYKPGTAKEQIIADGWARGFAVSQTVDELKAQGFEATADEVSVAFDRHQAKMEIFFNDPSEA